MGRGRPLSFPISHVLSEIYLGMVGLGEIYSEKVWLSLWISIPAVQAVAERTTSMTTLPPEVVY